MGTTNSTLVKFSCDAVQQVVQDKEDSRRGAEAEPTHPSVVPLEERHQDLLERQAPSLAPHKAQPLSANDLAQASLGTLHFMPAFSPFPSRRRILWTRWFPRSFAFEGEER